MTAAELQRCLQLVVIPDDTKIAIAIQSKHVLDHLFGDPAIQSLTLKQDLLTGDYTLVIGVGAELTRKEPDEHTHPTD